MPRQLISSGSPFEAQVGYSRAVVQGDWCFVAGTTGADPDTKVMPDDVVAQGRNALVVIGTALDELERSGGRYGLVTMCAAGGMAPAIIIERL